GNVKRFREGLDRPCQPVKGVHIVPCWRYLRKAEARQVGSNHTVLIREARNQLAEHERGCWKAVQQKHHRPIRWAGLSVEDADPIRCERADGRNRHDEARVTAMRNCRGELLPRYAAGILAWHFHGPQSLACAGPTLKAYVFPLVSS